MNLASFLRMYHQLSGEHGPQLEAIRQQIARKLWLAGLACAAIAILILLSPLRVFIFHIIALMLPAFFGYMYHLKRPYVLYFRENVAKSFVAMVDPNLSYSPEPAGNWHNWLLNQYHIACFDGSSRGGYAREMIPVDTRGSPGLSNFITGEIEGRPFQLCCMSLTGAGNDKTKFKGLFVSMLASKNLKGFIKVQRKIRGINMFGSTFIPGAEIQKMDNAAFEKDFFVGSNDQITAMQYLTADVMELLLNFKNELIDIQTRFNRNLFPQNPNLISLDLFWQGYEVLMRIGNKKMFKPTMRDPMCKDSLACCLSSLTFATRLNHVITKSINETAI